MNDNLILVVDYEIICRLCLLTTGAMSDLFEKNKGNTLKDLVLRATGLEVQQQDGLPTKICHRCRYIVELSCELREMVAKTNALLINAGNHLQILEEELLNTQETLTDTPHNTQETKHKRKERPDLRLILQDDGKMSLIKQDPGTPEDEKPDNINDWKLPTDTEEYKTKEKRTQIQEIITEKIKMNAKIRTAPPKHLTCQICLSTFSTAEEVGSHVTIHYTNSNLTPYTKLQRPFKCEVCKRTVSKKQLINHHRSHLDINPFVCKHAGCKFVGKTQDAIRRHLQTHQPRSQICEQCGATYKRRAELLIHAARAHRPAPAHCRQCRARFRNDVTLRYHVRHYHKPRRHKCSWEGCSKAYHTPFALKTHMRSHGDEREFRCHLCSHAAYTSQSLLNRHLRMHERARKSKCDKCSLTFDDYGAFYRHRVTEHGQWMRYRCPGCQKRYHTESKLEEHLETCEHALALKEVETENTDQLLETSIKEIVEPGDKSMEPEDIPEEITVDLLDKFKGQSLLVQPGNISELSKDLELQDLPADGLLYIEVDPEGDDDAHDAWQQ